MARPNTYPSTTNTRHDRHLEHERLQRCRILAAACLLEFELIHTDFLQPIVILREISEIVALLLRVVLRELGLKAVKHDHIHTPDRAASRVANERQIELMNEQFFCQNHGL